MLNLSSRTDLQRTTRSRPPTTTARSPRPLHPRRAFCLRVRRPIKVSQLPHQVIPRSLRPLPPSRPTPALTPSSSPLWWWWGDVPPAGSVCWRMISPVWESCVPYSSFLWEFSSAWPCVRGDVQTVEPLSARGTKTPPLSF